MVKTLAIPYYWSSYSKYWCARRDMLGLDGNEVAFRLEKSLDALKRDGIQPRPPPLHNPIWVLGLKYASSDDQYDVPCLELLPDRQRLQSFAYLLHAIRGLAIMYGFCKFIDSESHSSPPSVTAPWSLATAEYGKGVYYRHPMDGHIRVDTFSKAMEIYGFMMCNNESQEKLAQWFDIAMLMKGAPSPV